MATYAHRPNHKCTKTHRGVEVHSPHFYARVGTANAEKILAALVVRHENKIGPPKIVKLYQFVGSTLILPHTMLIPLTTLGFVAENGNKRPPAAISAPLALELFENQRIVVDRLMTVFTPSRITAGTAGAILNMRAGLGKTFTAAGVISRLGFRTLVVVVNSELARQMYDDLSACFDLRIGMLGGKPGKRRKSAPDDDITIIIINSALAQTREWLEGYAFLILDEIHAYCSDTRKNIFTAANFHAVLGMSATTDNRADEMDPIAHRAVAFDGVIHAESLPGFTFEDTKFDWNVTAISYSGPPAHTKALSHESTGRLFTPYMMKQFFADVHRCRLVRDRVMLRYQGGHNIYVFAEELAALAALQLELIAAGIPADEVVLFTGGIDEEDAARARASGRVLLATYGYAGTGISIPKMTAIVFMSPRRENMLQIVARIGRRGSDMSRPRVIDDIIDAKTPLRGQFNARKNAYEHYEMKMTSIKISWKEIEIGGCST